MTQYDISLQFFILMRTTKIRSACVCVRELEGLPKSALIKLSRGKCFKMAKELS